MVGHMFLYILKSTKDKGYYVGISCNLEKRLKCHNDGGVRSTKHRRPLIVIYKEKCESVLAARKREKYLKSYKGSKEKLFLIENCQIV